MNWYIAVLKKYAAFGGRARRKEYWMFVLFNMIISIVLSVVLGFISQSLGSAVSGIYSLAILVPAIAVGVRRMHDIGRSGWWLLFPIVNLIFACTATKPGDNEYGPQPVLD